MTPNDPTPDPPGGLERRTDWAELAIREDLERARLGAAAARQDMAAELTRDIQNAAPLDLGELPSAVERAGPVPSFGELESLLAGPEVGAMRIEEPILADLLREGIEGQTVLKRGLAFLKHKKYDLAVEWWSLNRQNLVPETSALHLLLLIMEALTHDWAGSADRAERTRTTVRAHPRFKGRGPAVRPEPPQ